MMIDHFLLQTSKSDFCTLESFAPALGSGMVCLLATDASPSARVCFPSFFPSALNNPHELQGHPVPSNSTSRASSRRVSLPWPSWGSKSHFLVTFESLYKRGRGLIFQTRQCAINHFWTKNRRGGLGEGLEGQAKLFYVRIFPTLEVFSGPPTGLT